jgi:hypothetical protein
MPTSKRRREGKEKERRIDYSVSHDQRVMVLLTSPLIAVCLTKGTSECSETICG